MINIFLGLTLSIIATLFFGANFITIGRGLHTDKLTEGIFITLVISTLTIFFGTILSGEFNFLTSLNPESYVLYMGAGFFNFVLGRTFNYSGITLIGPSRTSAIISSQVLFSVFFASLFLAETIDLLLLIGVFLAFIGISLVSLSQESNNKFVLRGVTFALIAAVSIGLAFVMIRMANLQSGKPIDGALISYITATFCYIPFVIKRKIKSKLKYSTKNILILIFAGFLSGMAQIARFLALELSPVALVASIIATNPLVTLILSFFINKKLEILNFKLVLGSIVAVTGVILVTLALNPLYS